jgi:hypothetical protein
MTIFLITIKFSLAIYSKMLGNLQTFGFVPNFHSLRQLDLYQRLELPKRAQALFTVNATPAAIEAYARELWELVQQDAEYPAGPAREFVFTYLVEYLSNYQRTNFDNPTEGPLFEVWAHHTDFFFRHNYHSLLTHLGRTNATHNMNVTNQLVAFHLNVSIARRASGIS